MCPVWEAGCFFFHVWGGGTSFFRQLRLWNHGPFEPQGIHHFVNVLTLPTRPPGGWGGVEERGREEEMERAREKGERKKDSRVEREREGKYRETAK